MEKRFPPTTHTHTPHTHLHSACSGLKTDRFSV